MIAAYMLSNKKYTDFPEGQVSKCSNRSSDGRAGGSGPAGHNHECGKLLPILGENGGGMQMCSRCASTFAIRLGGRGNEQVRVKRAQREKERR